MNANYQMKLCARSKEEHWNIHYKTQRFTYETTACGHLTRSPCHHKAISKLNTLNSSSYIEKYILKSKTPKGYILMVKCGKKKETWTSVYRKIFKLQKEKENNYWTNFLCRRWFSTTKCATKLYFIISSNFIKLVD